MLPEWWRGEKKENVEVWRGYVERDMKAMGIKEEMAQDNCSWRDITGGPTRASADA